MQSLTGAATASLAVWLMLALGQRPVYERVPYVPVGPLLGLYSLARRAAGAALRRAKGAQELARVRLGP